MTGLCCRGLPAFCVLTVDEVLQRAVKYQKSGTTEEVSDLKDT